MIFSSAADVRAFGASVIRLFVTAFARAPDPKSLASLVAQLRHGGSLLEIAKTIVALPEFLARHGPSGPADHHYVRALYWAVDGDDPLAEYAADLLSKQGASRETILLDVATSDRARLGISLTANLYPDGLPPDDDVAYQLWLEAYPEKPEALYAAARSVKRLQNVKFSILLQVPPIRPDLVEETLNSLSKQIWPFWECVLICTELPEGCRAAARALADRIADVHIIDVPIGMSAAEALNRAVEASGGVMFALVEPSDLLAPNALFEAANVLTEQPETLLIYTDEDRIGGDGARRDPSLKAGPSLDLLFAGDSFGQLTLFNRNAALRVGGFADSAFPFERYDLALRLVHHATIENVRHVSKILFHRGRLKSAKQTKFPISRPSIGTLQWEIVSRHLEGFYPSLALRERIQGGLYWPMVAAMLPLPAPRVSIIIPVRDRADLLERCLDGLLNATAYPDLEIIIVDNGSSEGMTFQLLQRIQHDPRVSVITKPSEFNWSELNNFAATTAAGQILLFLNNDIEVIEPDWLSIIAGHAMRADVGVVGARLIFPDGSLQHGGILLGPEAKAVHAYTMSTEIAGYLGQVSLGRDLSAVTGACLAVRSEIFNQVGGFDEKLKIAWGDVDLCLRVREAGYRVLWLPSAVLIHHEMATRGHDNTVKQQVRHELERAATRRRSYDAMEHDPFLNPNLTTTATSIVLASPPRQKNKFQPMDFDSDA